MDLATLVHPSVNKQPDLTSLNISVNIEKYVCDEIL